MGVVWCHQQRSVVIPHSSVTYLVYSATRKVQEITRLQHQLHHGFADLRVIKIATAKGDIITQVANSE